MLPTATLDRHDPGAVWSLLLQAGSEGPTLISCAARRFASLLTTSCKAPSAPSWRTIARTAHAALRLLADLRKETGQAIPLAWSPEETPTGVTAIEVYPAATWTAHGLRASGYKEQSQVAERNDILRGLAAQLELPEELNAPPLESADVLDAVVCLVAAQDFVRGHALPPEDPATAEREGWIWVRAPLANPHLQAPTA